MGSVTMNLDFEKSDGLITAVIQDHASGRVLMVGFMNEEAFRKTVETVSYTHLTLPTIYSV